ncbi:MAG: pentapeptide repeat-containing protein [Planctomycetota bacterium]|jgi:hypothetical protein
MNQQNQQSEKQKEQHRFNHWQYKFLKLCAKKGDEGIARWNKWRNRHLNRKILLDGADLTNLYLRDVNLGWGWPLNPRRHVYYGIGSSAVYLEGASFDFSDIKGGSFGLADLRDSNFMDAQLEGACFVNSDLRGAYFMHATVNGSTLIWECPVIRFSKKVKFTDFTGVSLNNCRIDPKTKQLLEYNIRRINWDKWYIGDKAKKEFRKIETKKEKYIRIWRVRLRLFATWPIRAFWSLSGYGRSTGRIICWFFGLAFVFALLYRLFPNFVKVYDNVGDIQGLWHAIYFSVVTMTTLGFGDIAANPESWLGQTLLMFQVILGYVLLGALVTRFAVLFTAGGPAGKFADEKEKKDETQQEAG